MSRNSITVLHVLPSLSMAYGGPVTNTVAASHALQQMGARVLICSVDNAIVPQEGRMRSTTMADLPPNLDGLEIQLFKGRFPHRFAYAPSMRAGMRAVIDDIDVIHIHQLFLYPQYVAFREASRAKVPYIVSPRGALDPYLRSRGRLRKKITDTLWQRRMLDNAAAIHLTSEEERRLIADLSFVAPQFVVPNGIDLEQFGTMPPADGFKKRLGLSGGELLVVNHGRLAQKKGLDILVDAIAVARTQIPDIHLVLIGPDSEGLAGTLKQRARGLGIENVVHFTGALQGSELLEGLAAADLWVLPSHTENFGNAVVEAMAAGKPVITSPYVNIALEAHDSGALLVVDNNAKGVADAIVWQLRSRDARIALGNRARNYAKRYEWSLVGSQLMDMYQSVLGRSSVLTNG